MSSRQKHKLNRINQNTHKRVVLFFLSFIIFLSAITTIPIFNSVRVGAKPITSESMSTDPDWKNKSLLVYGAIYTCLRYSDLREIDMTPGASFGKHWIPSDQVDNGSWFGYNGHIGSTQSTVPIGAYIAAVDNNALQVDEMQRIKCDNSYLIPLATNIWGISSRELLCNSGFKNESLASNAPISDCVSTKGTIIRNSWKDWANVVDELSRKTENAEAFRSYIIKTIYGGKEPSIFESEAKGGSQGGTLISKPTPTAFYFYRETLNQSCIKNIYSVQPNTTQLDTTKDTSYMDVKLLITDPSTGKNSIGTANIQGSLAKTKYIYIEPWKDITMGTGFNPNDYYMTDGHTLIHNGEGNEDRLSCQAIVNKMNDAIQSVIDETGPRTKTPVVTDGSRYEKEEPTCGNSVTGVGWIVCPVINALVGLNDMAWSITENLLIINPLKTSGNDNYVYQAWGTIRNIANVAFVIIFLMIIFSQTTGFGINNYGIKKLLPKMIIGAILVNLSFLLMQIFVDVANILGTSLYDIIKNSAPNIKTEMSFGIFMENFVGTVGAGALTIGGVALAGGSGSVFFLLLPVLASAALAIVAALLTLAFRQAALPILAILAPLAFVASLLPNTESWFKKWKKILIDALLLYPLAAIIFSGARFAAVILWGDGTDWFKSMVAMIVLALPLGSLPFIASKGGALTDAAFKGTKGMLDKLKNPISNWSKPRAELAKARYLSENGKTKFGRSAVGGFARRTAQRNALKNKELKLRTDTANKNFDTMFENSTQGRESIINSRIADSQLKAAQATNSRIISEATTATSAGVKSLTSNGFSTADATRIAADLHNTQRTIDIENSATNSATNIYKQKLNEDIASMPKLAHEMGGIDKYGAARAIANARANVEQTRNSNINSEISNLRAMQQSGNAVSILTTGTITDPISGAVNTATMEQKIAALKLGVQSTNYGNQKAIADYIGDPTNGLANEDRLVLQQEYFTEMIKSGKIKSLSGQDKGDLQTGTYSGKMDKKILNFFTSGKISPEMYQQIDKDELSDFVSNILPNSGILTNPAFVQQRANLLNVSKAAKNDPKIRNSLSQEVKDLIDKLITQL